MAACLVVGAGDGVGGAIARAFAAEGLEVCITRRARNLEQLEELAQSIRDGGGKARAYGVDARSEDEMIALVDKIEATKELDADTELSLSKAIEAFKATLA